LARPTTIELALDVLFAQLDSRRAAVEDDADAATVRFTPGSDPKKLSEAAAHWSES
jgi:hypothetical protein